MASKGSESQMDRSTEVNMQMNERSTGSNDQMFTRNNGAPQATDDLVYFLLTSEAIKENLLQFADNAIDELYKIASSGSPLWTLDYLMEEVLDKEVYKNMFMSNNKRREELSLQILHTALNSPSENSTSTMMTTPTQPLTMELSRSSCTVKKTPIDVVHMFMDVDQWLAMFPNIVSRTTIVGKILDDWNHDGSLIVMKAEFGLPTPNPETRECYFLRRSKKVNDSNWLIVDVSLDIPGLKYYRKPSGCLIEQVNGGFSRITWVEHNDIIIEDYLSRLFGEQVSSGFAFCAGRWMKMLKHQTENQYQIKQHLNAHEAGRANLLKLAHRMSQICMKKMNASAKKSWNSITRMGDAGNIFTAREHFENNQGRPDGNATTMTTSVRLPFSADRVYGSFQCAQCRPKWDISILGASAKKELHFVFEHDSTSSVSVLHIEIPEMEPIKYLQACFTNSISMYTVWTSLKTSTLNAILEGEDPDAVGILVSGAAVIAWDPASEDGASEDGESILTLLFETPDGTEVSSVKQDPLCSVITKTITLVSDLCTPPIEKRCSDEDVQIW